MKTNVLLIDNDLGFLFWLGQLLDKAGYEAFPARSIPDALKLIAELDLSIGLVVLNHSLEGAASFVASLRHAQKTFKIIGMVEDPEAPLHPDLDAQWRKPVEFDQNPGAQWLQIIRKVSLARATTG